MAQTQSSMMTTHRAIQISQLLDTATIKANGALRGVSNLQRIGNTKGAEFHLAKAEKWARIASKCRSRIDRDLARREQIKSGIAASSKLAIDADAMAEYYESKNDGSSVTARYNASVYRRTVKALEIQLETGVAVCSCCFKPLGRGISFLEEN